MITALIPGDCATCKGDGYVSTHDERGEERFPPCPDCHATGNVPLAGPRMHFAIDGTPLCRKLWAAHTKNRPSMTSFKRAVTCRNCLRLLEEK